MLQVKVGRYTALQPAINVALLHSRVVEISPTKVQEKMGGLGVPVALDCNFWTSLEKVNKAILDQGAKQIIKNCWE